MAFDPAENTTVFLGGDSLSSLGQSWTYNSYTWSRSFPGVPDTFPALAYDPTDSELIAFGGSAPIPHETGSTIPTNATYAFAAGAWINLSSNLLVGPPAAPLPMMATDPADGYALLLDPAGSANSSETWTFSNGTWANLTASAGRPPPGPSGADSVLTYDPAVGAVIFFGGSVPGPGYAVATNETWEFHQGRWTDLNLSGPDFTTGAVQTMAFDAASNALVDLVAPSFLYSVNGTPSYEDWGWMGGVWVNETGQLPATPPIGYDPLSEGDAADGYLFYMAGGTDSQSWALGSTPLGARVSVSPSPIDVGNATTVIVLVSGGAPPLRYAYSGLPLGCGSSSVPILACHPTQAGNFTIEATVDDSVNASVNASAQLEVGAPLSATGPLVSPGEAYLGSSVTFSVAVSGGLPPFAYSWVVPWPNCTTPNATRFSCTLGEAKTAPVSVTVTDATRTDQAVASENVTVVAHPAIVSFRASPALVEVGQSFVLNTSVTGGASPLVYAYSGLSLGCPMTSGPTVTCTPTDASAVNATVMVTDALGTVLHATVGVSVLAALAITAEQVSPNPAPVGATVTFGYAEVGGEGPFHSQWTDLPPGCGPSQSTFGCVMNASGSFDVGLTVRDALGRVERANVTLVVSHLGASSGGPSDLGRVPFTTWAVVGLGALALATLAVWERTRRRQSPPSDPEPVREAVGERAEEGERRSESADAERPDPAMDLRPGPRGPTSGFPIAGRC